MSDTINPIRAVTLSDGKTVVEVRELTWKDYLWAIKEVTKAAAPLLGANGVLNVNSLTELKVDTNAVLEALTSQEQTLSLVLQKSIKGSTAEQVNDLTARDTMKVLAAVVELNLSPEVVGAGKELAARMAAVFGSMTTSQGAVTSSSPTGTASRKSTA
jgi:uncharacterized protein